MKHRSSSRAQTGMIGLIQDAALEPALWQDVLEHVAGRIGGVAGCMLMKDSVRQTESLVINFGVDSFFVKTYVDHYAQVNPLLRSGAALLPYPVSQSMLTAWRDFTRTEFYGDWVRPQRFGDAVGAIVHRRGSQFTWLSAIRPRGLEDFRRDDLRLLARLMPHIAQSLRVTQRLDLLTERRHVLQDVLSRLTHAVMLVDRRGRLVFANTAAEDLISTERRLTLQQGRVSASSAAVDAALQAALARAISDVSDDQRGIEELVVPRDERRPLLLSVVPTTRDAAYRLDPDLRVAAMIVITDPEARPWSRLDGVIRAYGLTPAEGRILDALADGDGLDTAADRLGVTRATVKTHLNRILAKTGTTRQNQLVRLVAGTVPPLRRKAR